MAKSSHSVSLPRDATHYCSMAKSSHSVSLPRDATHYCSMAKSSHGVSLPRDATHYCSMAKSSHSVSLPRVATHLLMPDSHHAYEIFNIASTENNVNKYTCLAARKVLNIRNVNRVFVAVIVYFKLMEVAPLTPQCIMMILHKKYHFIIIGPILLVTGL